MKKPVINVKPMNIKAILTFNSRYEGSQFYEAAQRQCEYIYSVTNAENDNGTYYQMVELEATVSFKFHELIETYKGAIHFHRIDYHLNDFVADIFKAINDDNTGIIVTLIMTCVLGQFDLNKFFFTRRVG